MPILKGARGLRDNQNRQPCTHGEVDRLGITGQHDGRFVLLRLTHRLQKGPYHLCQQERKSPTPVRRD